LCGGFRMQDSGFRIQGLETEGFSFCLNLDALDFLLRFSAASIYDRVLGTDTETPSTPHPLLNEKHGQPPRPPEFRCQSPKPVHPLLTAWLLIMQFGCTHAIKEILKSLNHGSDKQGNRDSLSLPCNSSPASCILHPEFLTRYPVPRHPRSGGSRNGLAGWRRGRGRGRCGRRPC